MSLSDNVESPAPPQNKSYKPTRLAAKERLMGGESKAKEKIVNKARQKTSINTSHASEPKKSSMQHTIHHSASQGNIKVGHQLHSQKHHSSSHGKGAPSIDMLTNLTDEKLQILSRVEVSSPEVLLGVAMDKFFDPSDPPSSSSISSRPIDLKPPHRVSPTGNDQGLRPTFASE